MVKRTARRLSDELRKKLRIDSTESCGIFVGIRSYIDQEIQEVPYAVDDAVDLAWCLGMELDLVRPDRMVLLISGEPQKNFSKTSLDKLVSAGARLEDATAARVFRAALDARKLVGPQGLFVFSFAGHGLADQGQDLLYTSEVVRHRPVLTSLNFTALMTDLTESNAGRRWVILDACRGNLTAARNIGGEMYEDSLSSESYRSVMNSKGAAVFLGAVAGGRAYDDRNRRNGVFTGAIIDQLRGGHAKQGSLVTLGDIADSVNDGVKRWMLVNRPESCGKPFGIAVTFDPVDMRQFAVAADIDMDSVIEELELRCARALDILRGGLSEPLTTTIYDEIVVVFQEKGSSAELLNLLSAIEALDRTKSARDRILVSLKGYRSWKQKIAPITGPSVSDPASRLTKPENYPRSAASSGRESAGAEISRLKLLEDYLATWSVTKRRESAVSVSVVPEEQWEVVATADAFPEMPTFDEVSRIVSSRRQITRWASAVVFVLLSIGTLVPLSRSEDLGWAAILFMALAGGGFLASLAFYGMSWLYDQWTGMAVASWNWDFDNSFVYSEYWDKHQSPSFCDPHQIFWHRYLPNLYVSRDHRHLTGWCYDTDRIVAEPRLTQISGEQKIFSVGWINEVYWSESYFMVKSESFWWWHTGAALTHWVIYDERGEIRATLRSTSEFLEIFGSVARGYLRSNPWRPRHHGEILVFSSRVTIGTCQVSALPALLLFNDYDCQSVAPFLKKTAIDLAELRIRDDEMVSSYAWHPSGAYIAIEISGRIYIIHWESGETVSYHLPPVGGEYKAVGWSPDGRLLAVDEAVVNVWDAETITVRPAVREEKWLPWKDGDLESKLTSVDGIRKFDNNFYSNFPVNLAGKVKDVAWSKNPEIFATIGGGASSRDIRIWRKRRL